MGFGGIGPVQLIIVLAIILLIFGSKKLRNFGSDLGGAIKGFKKAMAEDEDKKKAADQIAQDEADSAQGETFEAKAEKVEEKN